MDSLDRTFGLIIAFVLPGFVVVFGLSPLIPELALWLSQDQTAPNLGGFSYAVLASLLAGMITSGIRWLVVDRLLHATGLHRPEFDFSRLQLNLQAFELAVQHNYRHYQFYANTAVSGWAVAAAHVFSGMRWSLGVWIGFCLLQAVQLAAGRDCLSRFYSRVRQILAPQSEPARQHGLAPENDDPLFSDDY